MAEITVGKTSYTTKELEKLLKLYLTDHTSRKYNFLYWNLQGPTKNADLCMVNLHGKKLNIINNSDLCFRITHVKRKQDWYTLKRIFNMFIPEGDNRCVVVISLTSLMSKLNAINWDVNALDLSVDQYLAKYYVKVDKNGKETRMIVAAPELDVQSMYLLDGLYDKYGKCVETPYQDGVTDILDEYISNDKFKFELVGGMVKAPVIDGLDIVARRYLLKSEEPRMYMTIQDNNPIVMYEDTNIIVVTLRVYMRYIVKSLKRRKRIKEKI